MLVCLQPLSQYKKKELYKHVETFELADPSLFEDAVITENLSICSLKKENIGKYDWMDLVLASCDQEFRLFYEWNIEHACGYSPSRDDKVTRADVNTDVDFIEGYLLYTKNGGGFTTRGFGYRYNIELSKDEFPTSGKLHIKFSNKRGKDNFCKYAYNYNGDKSKALSTKTILGCNSKAASNTYYFSIPQIDWSNIHINQKELWDKGLYDEAVLSEMGLKWNTDKTVIVKDE